MVHMAPCDVRLADSRWPFDVRLTDLRAHAEPLTMCGRAAAVVAPLYCRFSAPLTLAHAWRRVPTCKGALMRTCPPTAFRATSTSWNNFNLSRFVAEHTHTNHAKQNARTRRGLARPLTGAV